MAGDRVTGVRVAVDGTGVAGATVPAMTGATVPAMTGAGPDVRARSIRGGCGTAGSAVMPSVDRVSVMLFTPM